MTGSYLLDTSVISLFAPGRPELDERMADWLRAKEGRLFLSAVTILEIEQGVRKLFRTGAEARAKRLEEWLEATLAEFGDHVLAVDAGVAYLAGQMAGGGRLSWARRHAYRRDGAGKFVPRSDPQREEFCATRRRLRRSLETLPD